MHRYSLCFHVVPSPSSTGLLSACLQVAVALLGTSSYSYKELAEATTNFHEKNKLGEGAFGKVYYGVFRGNKCAIKKLQEVSSKFEIFVELSLRYPFRYY